MKPVHCMENILRREIDTREEEEQAITMWNHCKVTQLKNETVAKNETCTLYGEYITTWNRHTRRRRRRSHYNVKPLQSYPVKKWNFRNLHFKLKISIYVIINVDSIKLRVGLSAIIDLSRQVPDLKTWKANKMSWINNVD